MSESLEEHISFDQLRSIVGDALYATTYGRRVAVWPARYAAHVDLLLRIIAQKDATIAGLRGALEAWQRWYESMQTDGGRRLLKIPGNSHVLHAGIKGREALALLAPAPREGT